MMNTTDQRKTYYVSVQAQTVFENQGDSSYEFEIQADEKDLTRLVELFENQMENEHDTAQRAIVPGVPYHRDVENDRYDATLKDIYKAIHSMGTEATRKHIQSMGILNDNELQ
jgi:hypothetical protein